MHCRGEKVFIGAGWGGASRSARCRGDLLIHCHALFLAHTLNTDSQDTINGRNTMRNLYKHREEIQWDDKHKEYFEKLEEQKYRL